MLEKRTLGVSSRSTESERGWKAAAAPLDGMAKARIEGA